MLHPARSVGKHGAMTDVTLQHLDGPATIANLDEIQAVYHQAFPDYDLNDHTWRTTNQAKANGFATIVARVDGHMVGFVYGLNLSEKTTWWNNLDPDGPDGFASENGHRTVAVIDLCVLPSQQGHGLGKQLMAEFLASRTEQRATLATAPHEVENQQMYERWGWRKVGRVPGSPGTTEPVFELYVIDLREPDASNSR